MEQTPVLQSTPSQQANTTGNSNPPLQQHQETPQIGRLGLHLPEFKQADPELWFALADRAFSAAGIMHETTKFAHAVAHLGTQFGNEVRDIILNPPLEFPYTCLKEQMIKRLGSSQASKTKKLIEEETIGDLRPSQFMRRLRTLGGSTINDELIRTIWLSRLPKLTQAILAAHSDLSLDKLSELADSILEYSYPQSSAIHSIRPSAVNDQPDNDYFKIKLAQFDLQMKNLEKEIHELKIQNNSLSNSSNSNQYFQPRARSSFRPRSRSRSSSRHKQEIPPGLCWYHWRYGNRATKCKSPCNFNQGKEN